MRENTPSTPLVTRSFTGADDRELRRMTRSLFSYPRIPDMLQELMCSHRWGLVTVPPTEATFRAAESLDSFDPLSPWV